MKIIKTISIVALILFVALWEQPLEQAFKLLLDSQEYYDATRSVDAHNDLTYSFMLLGSYQFSLLASFVFSWLLYRNARLLMLIPAALLVYAALEVLRIRPEAPIVFFPTIHFLRPSIISFAAACMAYLIAYPPFGKNQ